MICVVQLYVLVFMILKKMAIWEGSSPCLYEQKLCLRTSVMLVAARGANTCKMTTMTTSGDCWRLLSFFSAIHAMLAFADFFLVNRTSRFQSNRTSQLKKGLCDCRHVSGRISLLVRRIGLLKSKIICPLPKLRSSSQPVTTRSVFGRLFL